MGRLTNGGSLHLLAILPLAHTACKQAKTIRWNRSSTVRDAGRFSWHGTLPSARQ